MTRSDEEYNYGVEKTKAYEKQHPRNIVFTGNIKGNDPHKRQEGNDFLDSCCQCGDYMEDCKCKDGCYHSAKRGRM